MSSAGRVTQVAGKLQVILSESDKKRIQTLLEELVGEVPTKLLQPMVFVQVKGHGNVVDYLRARPGQKALGRTLGRESFALFGILISVGFQTYDDWSRDDLNGSQKLGRASLALLGGALPPLGLAMLGASLIWPDQADDITKRMFSDSNPVVQWLADRMVEAGGEKFQEWSLKPSWVDFF